MDFYLVGLQEVFTRSPIGTNGAVVWFFTRVGSDVALEVAVLPESGPEAVGASQLE